MPDIGISGTDSPLAQDTVNLQQMADGLRQTLLRPSSSRSQRAFQEAILAERTTLEQTGMLKPSTIINFNPVVLSQDGLINLRIPPAGFDEISRVEFEFNGQKYLGHCFTQRSPVFYGSVDGHEMDPQAMMDVPRHVPRYLLPIGVAYSFLEHYSGAAKDSPHMGGVLVFEGDRHTLSPTHLDRTGGMIKVPKPINLPKNRRAYTSEERSLEDVVNELFNMQAIYCNDQIQRAHANWSTNDPLQQRMISEPDRVWARFALEHGMIEQLPEWAHKNILSGKALTEVVRCPLCGKGQTNPSILLCPHDHAPYNTLAAFLAGAPVAKQYLDLLDGVELDQYALELARREQRQKSAMVRAKKIAAAEAKDEGTAE